MISQDERVLIDKLRLRHTRRRRWDGVVTAVLVVTPLVVALLDGVRENLTLIVVLLVGAAASALTEPARTFGVAVGDGRLTMTRHGAGLVALTVMAGSIGAAAALHLLGSDPPEDFAWTTLPWLYLPVLVVIPVLIWWEREHVVITADGVSRARRGRHTTMPWDQVGSVDLTADGAARLLPVGFPVPGRAAAQPAGGFVVPTFDAGLDPRPVFDALTHWARQAEDRAELGTTAALDRLRAT